MKRSQRRAQAAVERANQLWQQKKTGWIRDCCTDCYEGIPCNYPDCTCTPENKRAREQDFRDHIRREAERKHHERIANHIDGYDRDDLGESPDF